MKASDIPAAKKGEGKKTWEGSGFRPRRPRVSQRIVKDGIRLTIYVCLLTANQNRAVCHIFDKLPSVTESPRIPYSSLGRVDHMGSLDYFVVGLLCFSRICSDIFLDDVV